MRNNRLTALALAILLSACSQKTLTPPLPPVAVELPQSWQELSIHEALQPDGKAVQELGWRDFYRDPRLQKLIAEALAHNHDLRSYVLDTQIAELNYGITYQNREPTVNGSAGIGRQDNTKGSRPGQNSFTANLSGNFDLDLWGGKTAASDQALNQFLATREGQDSAKLGLIRSVAGAYYQSRIIAAQIALSQKILQLQQEKYRLAALQSSAGVITNIDLRQFEEAVEQAKIGVLEGEGNQQKALNALALLVGRPLAALDLPAASVDRQAFSKLHVPSVPSEALLQRPDIRVAELQLRAANANIGVARANLYPNISLGAGLNLASSKLSEFFSNGLGWSVNSNISALIFNRDKLHKAVKISELQQEKALESYKKTVKAAFYEVADLLNERETLQEKYRTQLKVGKAVAERLRLENLRFQAGVTSATDLLNAQSAANSSDLSLLNIELQMLNNQVNLYNALGGGLVEGNSAPSLEAPAQLLPAATSANDEALGIEAAPAPKARPAGGRKAGGKSSAPAGGKKTSSKKASSKKSSQ